MGESLLTVMFFGGLGIFILWFTMIGRSPVPHVTVFVGVWCILLAIFVFCGWDKAAFMLLAGMFGGMCMVSGIEFLKINYRHCIRGKGEYIRPVLVRRRKGFRYYVLECKYSMNGKTYRKCSYDSYKLETVEKKYLQGEQILIWVDKTNPNSFLIKRYPYILGGIFFVCLGLVLLGAIVYVIFYR